MIIDSSALIAILRAEPDAKVFADAIKKTTSCKISAATFVETAIVIDSSRDPISSGKLDQLLKRASIAIEPLTEAQARTARQAYRDFGRGSGHPARLNFGDCFAYALAKDKGEPLLFKGDDFSKTDVTVA